MAKLPHKWKMSLLIWLFVYPLILIITGILRKLFPEMPTIWAMLITSMVIVSCMVYLVIPLINKVLGKWIRQ